MIVSIGFILLMIVVGGISAFVADLLGFKIGKKRLSVLRIRPKYVARIAVTIAGMLIPLASVLVLSAVSNDFRRWVSEGPRAIEQAKEAVRERDEIQGQLTQFRAQAARLENQARQQREEYGRTVLAVTKQRKLLAELRTSLTTQQRLVARYTAEVRKSQSLIRELGKRNDETRAQLLASRKELENEQKALGLIRKERETAILDRDFARQEFAEIGQKNQELILRNQELVRDTTALQQKIEQLGAEVGQLVSERDRARDDARNAKAELGDLQKSVRELREQQDRLLQSFRNDFALTRTQPLTFFAREELARAVVPAGLSVVETKNIVTSLLRACRVEAEKRGAKAPGRDGATAFLVPRENLSPLQQEELWQITLSNSRENQVLVARSYFNSFEGEPVQLEFVSYPNPVVLTNGELVAESRIDGRRDEPVVYAQIVEFLAQRVQERAKRERMVPIRVGVSDSYGQLEPGELLRIVRQVKDANRVVRLQAWATQDIRAGDRLAVELRIR